MADRGDQAAQIGLGEPLTYFGNEPSCMGVFFSSQTVLDVPDAQRRKHRIVVAQVNVDTAVYVVAGVSLATIAARQAVPVLNGLRKVLSVLGRVARRNSSTPGSHELENAGTVQFRWPAGEAITGTPVTSVEALEMLPKKGLTLLITGTSPGHEDDTSQGLVVSDTETENGTRLEFVALDSADQAGKRRDRTDEDKEEWAEREKDAEKESEEREEDDEDSEEHEEEWEEGEEDYEDWEADQEDWEEKNGEDGEKMDERPDDEWGETAEDKEDGGVTEEGEEEWEESAEDEEL